MTDKPKQRTAHSASENTVGQNDAPDISTDLTADFQIEGMTKICDCDSSGDRSKIIVSLDCCANHSFAFCTDITSDIQHVNFTVEGIEWYNDRKLNFLETSPPFLIVGRMDWHSGKQKGKICN